MQDTVTLRCTIRYPGDQKSRQYKEKINSSPGKADGLFEIRKPAIDPRGQLILPIMPDEQQKNRAAPNAIELGQSLPEITAGIINISPGSLYDVEALYFALLLRYR